MSLCYRHELVGACARANGDSETKLARQGIEPSLVARDSDSSARLSLSSFLFLPPPALPPSLPLPQLGSRLGLPASLACEGGPSPEAQSATEGA